MLPDTSLCCMPTAQFKTSWNCFVEMKRKEVAERHPDKSHQEVRRRSGGDAGAKGAPGRAQRSSRCYVDRAQRRGQHPGNSAAPGSRAS